MSQTRNLRTNRMNECDEITVALDRELLIRYHDEEGFKHPLADALNHQYLARGWSAGVGSASISLYEHPEAVFGGGHARARPTYRVELPEETAEFLRALGAEEIDPATVSELSVPVILPLRCIRRGWGRRYSHIETVYDPHFTYTSRDRLDEPPSPHWKGLNDFAHDPWE